MQKFRDKYQAEILAGAIILFGILFIGSVAFYTEYECKLNRSVKNAVVTSKGYYITDRGMPVYNVTITGIDKNGEERSVYFRVDENDYRKASVGNRW